MNLGEIDRIGAEAAADEAALDQEQQQAGQVAPLPSVADELADFLDFAAKIGTKGLGLPIDQRFDHAANVEIATAAVKLCEKYNLDPRKLLIGPDSSLGAWLGLAAAIGLPGYALYNDYKIMKAKEVKQEGVTDGGQADKQPSE